MTQLAIYPGTFDPITHGHSDIAARAAQLFDQLIVAVAVECKNTLFSFDQRLQMTQQVLVKYKNVRVAPLTGLLADFAAQQGACVVIRGLRSIADVEYELQMATANQTLMPGLETLFLAPSRGLSHISGSLVREIMSFGGDISAFVDPIVVKACQYGIKNY